MSHHVICSQSKIEGKHLETIQSSTTFDLGHQWESDKTHDKVFFEVSHRVIRSISKEEGKHQESIQSSTALDLGNHMGK